METLVVHEMDYLGLKGWWAQALSNLCSAEKGAAQSVGDEDGVKDGLWTPSLPPTITACTPDPTLVNSLDGFWELIRDELQPIVSDPPPGISILLHEPSARQAFMKLFLRLAELQVARRKPEFVSVAESLGSIRGRLLVNELVKRKATRRLPVWCEFDALDANNLVWQAIRHAVGRCSQEISGAGKFVDLALEIDARLSDVTIGSMSEIVRSPMQDRTRQGNQALLAVYRMALAILTDQALIARPAPEEADGAVFTFKIATSGVWERLVSLAVDSTRNYRVINSPRLKQLFEEGTPKEVDIHVANCDAPGHSVLLIDGKYKKAANSVTNASMGDQYQIYAYANLWNAPAVLAYPLTGDSAPSVRMTTAFENRGSQVGAIRLPFPKPGQTKIPVKPIDIERLLNLIVHIPEIDEPRTVRD